MQLFLPTQFYENYALLVTGIHILLKDSITEEELHRDFQTSTMPEAWGNAVRGLSEYDGFPVTTSNTMPPSEVYRFMFPIHLTILSMRPTPMCSKIVMWMTVNLDYTITDLAKKYDVDRSTIYRCLDEGASSKNGLVMRPQFVFKGKDTILQGKLQRPEGVATHWGPKRSSRLDTITINTFANLKARNIFSMKHWGICILDDYSVHVTEEKMDLYILERGALRLNRDYRNDVLALQDDQEPGADHREFRHAAYRQFVVWQHGRLGEVTPILTLTLSFIQTFVTTMGDRSPDNRRILLPVSLTKTEIYLQYKYKDLAQAASWPHGQEKEMLVLRWKCAICDQKGHLAKMCRKGGRERLQPSNDQEQATEKKTSAIEDITDGSMYTSIPELQDNRNISFLMNTDGIKVFHSSNYGLWPVYLAINELPFRMRCKRTSSTTKKMKELINPSNAGHRKHSGREV
ncbi:hypothetical protein Bbelb_036350 [Branchiostoma belcheri]|nr:hypothetical protein Bbelb_036350 [Branchiostoma belcheri]